MWITLISKPRVLVCYLIVLTGFFSGCSTLSRSEKVLVGGDFLRMQDVKYHPATPSANSQSMAYFSLGLHRELQGDYRGAIDAFQEAIRNDPANDALYMIASGRLVQADRTEDAKRLLQELIELQPDNGVAHRWLAKLYLQEGFVDKAREEMMLAVNSLPDSEQVYMEALQLALQEKDLELALEILRKANLHAERPVKSTELLLQFLEGEINRSPDIKSLVNLEAERNQILEKAIEDFPETEIFTFIQAERYIDQSKWGPALKSYTELDKRKNATPEIREKILIHAIRSLGGGRQGVRSLRKALHNHQDSGFVYYLSGLLNEMTDDSAAAMDDYKKAYELEKNHYATLLKLALLKYQSNQTQEAVRFVEDVLISHPNDPDAVFLAGRIFLATEDYERARKYLQKRIYLSLQGAEIEEPEILYAQFSMALLALEEESQLIADTMVKASEEPGYLEWIWRFQLGSIYVTRERDEGEAKHMQAFLIELLEDLADRLPENPEVEWLLGRMYGTQKEYSKMLQAYQRYENLAKNHPSPEIWLTDSFYFDLAAAYERTGQLENSEELFEKIITGNPQHHPSLNYLAYMWAERSENLDQAEHYVKRALAMEPDNGSYLDTLGWIYYQQGKFKIALRELLRSAELEPDQPVILEHLGDVLMKLSRPWEARGYYRIALILDKNNDRREIVEKALQRAEIEISNQFK